MKLRSLLVGVCLLLGLNTLAFADASNRKPAETFNLESLSGAMVSSTDYSDTVLLVNFWGSWCPPCVAELPSMQALRESMAGRPFEILAVNVGEEPDRVRNFVKHFKTRLEFPILINADQDLINKWGVLAMPTTALIDKQGRIASFLVGPRDWNSEKSRQQVVALLDE